MTSADAWKELKEFNNCEPSSLAFRAMVALLDKIACELPISQDSIAKLWLAWQSAESR
jgi:hypothetical protein